MVADCADDENETGDTKAHAPPKSGASIGLAAAIVSPPSTDSELKWLIRDERVYRGNIIEFLTEGAEYFEQWFYSLDRLIASSAEVRRLMHHAWRLADIARFGRLSASTSVVDQLRRATSRGVDVRLSVSGHGWGAVALTIPTISKLLRIRGLQTYVDLTAPSTVQSNHQKLSVFEVGDEAWALIGSIDLAPTRFERSHERVDLRRYKSHRGPSHDVGLKLVGPAAIELQRRFAGRWSALCAVPGRRRIRQLSSCTPVPPRPTSAIAADTPGSSVQVVETIPPRSDLPFPPSSTLARIYRKALLEASTFIYIEDQYFTPDFRDTDAGRRLVSEEENLLPLLMSALDRGVYVIILMPAPDTGRQSLTDRITAARRDAALCKLLAHPGSNRCLLLQYSLPTHPIYIHSKLLLCDDIFMLLGSANVNRRSMFTDFEIGVAVVDPLLIQGIRIRLWAEHAGLNGVYTAGADYTSPESMIQHLVASDRLTQYKPYQRNGRRSRFRGWFADRYIDPVR